jgi:ABC-type branched-subunit amino acid transport system ATPase component
VVRHAASISEQRRAMELLDFVGITRLAHEPAGNLSYGQRKLLELASPLVADPAILPLDEPADGVNPTLIGHLSDRIRELGQAGQTILVVEHNMEFVMSMCSRVTVLAQGRTLIAGSPADVRSNPAVLDAYLGGEDDGDIQRGLAGKAPERSPGGVSANSGHTARRPKLGESSALLSLAGVTSGYGGDILKDVTLEVPRGGITCVVGPNGAGKSTLLATISGLLRTCLGEVRLDGELISGRSPREIRGRGLRRSRRRTACFRT